jgi:hypothetical protein
MCGYGIASPNGGMPGRIPMAAIFMLTCMSVFMPIPTLRDGINDMDWMYGGPLGNSDGLTGNPMEIICKKKENIPYLRFTIKNNRHIVN